MPRSENYSTDSVQSFKSNFREHLTVEDKYLMRFLSWGMRMNIRYPHFTAIELWVLVISIIVAAGIQI
jgi:hypothetical protein